MRRSPFKPKKTAKCKICQQPFQKRSMAHVVCNDPKCRTEYLSTIAKRAERKIRKREREEAKERREKLKTRSDYLREAQEVINRYVRLRDRDLGCVSCDKPPTWGGQWHASHFRSVGSCSALRFHLWNIHKSCSVCNNWKSGNLIEYEPRLRAKIGNEKVDWLRTQNQPTEYSIEYLIRLKKVFLRKIKRTNR